MATEKVYTNIVVTIAGATDEEEAFMEASIESEDNGGVSSYVPNTSYLLRLYKSDKVRLNAYDSNIGNVSPSGSDSESIEDEIIVFTGSDSGSSNKMIASSFRSSRIGSAYDKDGDRTTVTLTPIVGTKTIKANKEIYGVFSISYVTKWRIYKFSSSQAGTMVIFFIGEYTT